MKTLRAGRVISRMRRMGRPGTSLLLGSALADKVQMVLGRIGGFFNRLKTIAEQLSCEAIWAIILSVAFRVWLRGKSLHPVVGGNQTLLVLTT